MVSWQLYVLGVFLVLIAALYQYKEDLDEFINRPDANVYGARPDKAAVQDDRQPTASSSEDETYFNPPFDPDHPEERYSKTGTRLVTINELSAHGPEGPLKPIWLAILGRVYDVNRGADSYYGPNGGYKVFSGRDATRAFVTGEFKGAGLTDDVAGLSPLQLGELDGWVKFYDKEYTYVGKLIGRYYNKDGSPTKEWYKFQRGLADKDKLLEEKKKEDEKFPGCNSHWTEKDGGKVYCSDKSGGISRDWAGYPRRYFSPGATTFRCACVHEDNLSSPHVRLYPDCDPKSDTCQINKEKLEQLQQEEAIH